MKKRKNDRKKQEGQTLPVVLIIAAILSIFAATLVSLLRFNAISLVRYSDTLTQQEIAAVGVEHAIYALQQGSNWDNLPLTGYQYDQVYQTKDGNSYELNILDGNQYINTQTVTTHTGGWWGGGSTTTTTLARQGQNEYKTIGVKVMVNLTNSTKNYYAVVKRGYGGPLISKGIINLPCVSPYNQNRFDYLDFYWGDIYSANASDGACRIPFVKVAQGTADNPQPWMPEIFAAGNIYTCSNCDTQGNPPSNPTYNYTYDEMSPTAHCHPYSSFAKAPQLDLEDYKKKAKDNGAYFGPPVIGGTGAPNPYYIDDNHTIGALTTTPSFTYGVDILNDVVNNLQSAGDYLFIDTTDALPLRPPSGSTPANTYCGTTLATSPKAISIYADNNNQYFTRGYMCVEGPLILMGNDPDQGMPSCGYGCSPSNITRVSVPDTYYFPQNDTAPLSGGRNAHWNGRSGWGGGWRNNNGNQYYTLSNVKHGGFIYVNGELKIGGVRVSGGYGGAPYSDVCVFGTVYLDTYGSLSMDTVNDDPAFYIFFDTDRNLFSYMGNNLILVTFGEWTWLVPTPGPYVTPG